MALTKNERKELRELSIRAFADDIERIRDEARNTKGAMDEGFGMWFATNLYKSGYRYVGVKRNE